MAVTLKLPTPLRARAGQQKIVTVEASTVGEALEALVTAYPDLRSSVFTASGEINKFLRVFLGERDTADLNGRETPVSDGDELSLVTPIAGG